jgi:putative transcriptional regulator
VESQLYMAQEIANRVKELRTARSWTQEELARAVGVSRQSINSIERNRYVPSLELALTFAQVFATAVDNIFQLRQTVEEQQA